MDRVRIACDVEDLPNLRVTEGWVFCVTACFGRHQRALGIKFRPLDRVRDHAGCDLTPDAGLTDDSLPDAR